MTVQARLEWLQSPLHRCSGLQLSAILTEAHDFWRSELRTVHHTLHYMRGLDRFWPSIAEDCSEIDAATYVLQSIQMLLHWRGEHVAALNLHATMK